MKSWRMGDDHRLAHAEPVAPGRADRAARSGQCGAVDGAAWDRFVVESHGSFLGSWKVIRAESVLRTVRVFELVSPSPAGPLTIGRCAIAVANRRIRFLDRLHLLPAFAGGWPTPCGR